MLNIIQLTAELLGRTLTPFELRLLYEELQNSQSVNELIDQIANKLKVSERNDG